MAAQLKLVRLNDFAADIDSVDLLTSGYSLAANSYAPAVAPIGAKSVHETITLNLKGTSTDDLALMVQDIDEKIKQVQWWIDDPGVERYQVWLRVQMDEESSPRQAQILNIEPPNRVNEFPISDTSEHHISEYQFGIERTPFWEMPNPYPGTTAKTGLNTIGGTVALSETINGDVPARVARLSFTPSGNLVDFWAGWKTSRFGNPANFLPVWELHYGTEVDADTSEVADAGAYDGTMITTTFSASALLILRQAVLLDSIMTAHSGTAADQRGSYLVLLRAKMSDTSVARVQMIAGLYSGGTFQAPVYRSRVVVNSANWGLYELGTIKIPPVRLPSSYNFSNMAIGLLAERLSGSGALNMDCVVLIPHDDGAIKLESTGRIASTQIAEVFQAADGALYATAQHQTGKSIYSVVPKSQGEWGLPANNEAPYIVVAAQDLAASGGSFLGSTVDISYAYIPRWRTLRGNVT